LPRQAEFFECLGQNGSFVGAQNPSSAQVRRTPWAGDGKLNALATSPLIALVDKKGSPSGRHGNQGLRPATMPLCGEVRLEKQGKSGICRAWQQCERSFY
jgi:hypothetical protein